ncbi:MAG: anti-phage protein KwaB [Lachnospiraceae bacterium]|nr:anti-phage protein KwaB [Lachnospiraceae bacterium]
MTTEELKSEVKSTLEKPHSMQIYLVFKKDHVLSMRLADIEDNHTAPEIQKMFTDFLQNTLLANDDLTVRKLSVADEQANTIYQYDYDNFPEELRLIKDFDISCAVQMEKFNFHTDNLSHLFGYIIYLGAMDNGIIMFKKHYPIMLVKRDSFLLGAIKSTERFERLPQDDIIRLNDDVQLLRINGHIYILDLKVLERNMGFTALIQKGAEETIEAVKRLEIVEDIQVLRDTLDDLSFTRKLSKIKKASPIFRLGITKETIIQFTKTTPALAGRFKYSEDGTAIRLDTKKTKDAFLKLMNDSFLCSELTRQYYEASAKDNITQTTE